MLKTLQSSLIGCSQTVEHVLPTQLLGAAFVHCIVIDALSPPSSQASPMPPGPSTSNATTARLAETEASLDVLDAASVICGLIWYGSNRAACRSKCKVCASSTAPVADTSNTGGCGMVWRLRTGGSMQAPRSSLPLPPNRTLAPGHDNCGKSSSTLQPDKGHDD